MTDNNDLIAEMSSRINELKTGKMIHRAVAIELGMWQAKFQAELQKQYENGVNDSLLKGMEIGAEQERERIKKAVASISYAHTNDMAGTARKAGAENMRKRVLEILKGKT